MQNQHGFTLMELIITMVIIGILTAIAIPNYTAYIQRSNRSEARNALLEAAAWMERWRTQTGVYGSALATPTAAPPLPFTQVPQIGTAKYTIAAPTIAALGIGYSITATAVGVMATDVCSTLTITETGARTFTTGGGGTQQICWNR
jgi:type IV pilus assembly protein PilE